LNVSAGRTVYKNAERPEASGWGVATLLREIIAKDGKTRGGEGKGLSIRTLYLPALIVAGVLLACAAALLAVSKEANATFPGKNGRIAYWSNFVIYTINPNGSAKTKVTNTNTGGDIALDYSPDGKRITYTDYEGFNGKGTEIYTIKVGGDAKTKVTNNNRDDSDPSYSPDGKRIAYTHWDGHDDEIWTSNTDGTGKFQVTNNGTMDLSPAYSPDGKKIVFSGEHRKLFFPWTYAIPEIYTIGVNGKNRVQLTHNSTYDYYPDYSPNGRRIAYAGTGERSLSIYTIRAHGGGKTKVAEEGFDSSYSPDGKKIAYSTGKKIYTINVGGGGKSKVTEGSNLAWGSRP
jgi:TolB protein